MLKDKIGIPIKYYHHPKEIDEDRSLTIEEKVKALVNWLDDIKLKLIAEDESMISTNPAPRYFTNEIRSLLEKYDS